MYNSIYAGVPTARGISMPWEYNGRLPSGYLTYISVGKLAVLYSLMIYLLRVLISRSYVTLPKGILSYM